MPLKLSIFPSAAMVVACSLGYLAAVVQPASSLALFGHFILAISLLASVVAMVLATFRMAEKLNEANTTVEAERAEVVSLKQQLEQSAEETRRTVGELAAYKAAIDKHSIVATTDLSGRITHVNDKFCEISQYSREELIGRTHRIINSGHHSRSFWTEAWKQALSGQTWRSEVCNRAKDGSLYWLDTTICALRTSNEKYDHLIAIRTDITARKHIEEMLLNAREEADEANSSKSDFLANMSHEIRTPMTAILGYADMLLEEGDLARAPEVRVNAIRTIQRNGQHLLGVINDILDISKIEAGKLSVERHECSPCQVLSEVISLMQVRAEEREITLSIEPDGPLPKIIQSDSLRLRQILLNLLGNAIKFTEQGSVRLIPRLVDEKTPSLQFDIVDTGIGMSEEQASRLFQAFTQADTTMARRFGGTGLGLTISRRLASMLGGDIQVVATAPGEGTTMRATVDTGAFDQQELVHDVAAAVGEAIRDQGASHEDQEVSCEDPLAGMKILLAEDGVDNQRLISHFLRKAGATVDIAENGRAAVELVWKAVDASAPYTIVLMDMQMPIMSGYQATRALRDKHYQKPVVALTAHAMGGEMDKCIAAGCDGYLTKPINKRALVNGVLKYAQRSAQLSA